MIIRWRSRNAVTQNGDFNRTMGTPIDPRDPVNGGVPTCIEWMPNELFAACWQRLEYGYMSGVITSGHGAPGIYNGDLFGPFDPWPFTCVFGVAGTHIFQALLNFVPFLPVNPWDCDLPVTFEDPPGIGMWFGIVGRT